MINFRQLLDLGGFRLTNVGTPTATTDAATKTYVDTSSTIPVPLSVKTANYTLTATDYAVAANNNTTGITFTLPVTGLSVGRSYLIKNIGTATLSVQAAGGAILIDGSGGTNLAQYESRQFVWFSSAWWTATNQSFFGGVRLQSVGNPTALSDAATKGYVDSVALRTQTVSYSIATTDDTIIGNSTTPITFTLPDPNTFGYNKRYSIKNIGAGLLTVVVASGLLIDGASSITLRQYEGRLLWTDSANRVWYTQSLSLDAALKVAKTGDTMSGALAMGGNKITGLGTPTTGTDAATKSYADTAVTTVPLTSVTTNYTASATDYVIMANSAGALTVTLPAASSTAAGRTYQVKNINLGLVTVAAAGADLIDGSGTVVLQQYVSRTAVCDGVSNWYII